MIPNLKNPWPARWSLPALAATSVLEHAGGLLNVSLPTPAGFPSLGTKLARPLEKGRPEGFRASGALHEEGPQTGRQVRLRPAAGSGTMTAIALCTDDRCLLRDDCVGSVFIADLVLRVMSGEDVSELISSKPSFTRKDQCLECVLRVMRDRRPLRTVAEYEKLVDAGRWSHRRWRRRARREQRESASRPVTTSFL